MKKILLLISSAFLFTLMLVGCSAKLQNSITFNNMSASDLYINFRGSTISVPSGKVVSIKEIPHGTFTYATTYSIPPEMTGTANGDVSGSVTINASTRIQVIFSSAVVGTSYTLYATISNSDDQSNLTGP